MNRAISREEEERGKVQADLKILTDRLARVSDQLERKKQARAEYDKTIKETEDAYMKILESSHILVEVLRRESKNLQAKNMALQA